MAKKKRTKKKGPTLEAPVSQGRGTLTVRLDPALLNALRLAVVQQRVAGQQPRSKQGIVEDALREWIEERGYEV